MGVNKKSQIPSKLRKSLGRPMDPREQIIGKIDTQVYLKSIEKKKMISLHSQLFLLTLWTPISNDAIELVVHQKFSFCLAASEAS